MSDLQRQLLLSFFPVLLIVRMHRCEHDDDTVHKIYLKMLRMNIQNITTILWFVVDVRVKASYKRQARFIEKLAKYYPRNVWNNTIIVIKGDTILGGPRDAAREIA